MTPPSPSPTVITVVQSSGCHFCADAHAAVTELTEAFPLAVEWLDAGDPQGASLVAQHRSPMYPLVLVDGAFFSFGRLPRKKLRKLLGERYAAAVR